MSGVLMLKFLQVGKVAEKFGVDPSTIHLWIRKGSLKAQRTLGGHFRIPIEEVERLEKELTDLRMNERSSVRNVSESSERVRD
jgi:excisionase family DNA binding protein